MFLERQSYRGRRLVDFLRFLPLIGSLLWAVPMLWPTGAQSTPTTSQAIVYIFGVWFAMVLASAVVSFSLRRSGLSVERRDG